MVSCTFCFTYVCVSAHMCIMGHTVKIFLLWTTILKVWNVNVIFQSLINQFNLSPSNSPTQIHRNIAFVSIPHQNPKKMKCSIILSQYYSKQYLMETCLQNCNSYLYNLYFSRKIIASSIVTKLIMCTEHLAIPTARLQYRLRVGMPLSCVSTRGDPSRLNQEKLRLVYSLHLFMS